MQLLNYKKDMKRLFVSFCCFFVFITITFSQVKISDGAKTNTTQKATINWIPLQEAFAKSNIDNKPIFIDLYTDWCGYCKRMDALTFSDTSVISYINAHFYAVKFDAETMDKITYRDSVYTNSRYVQGQKKTAHDLAVRLTNNHLVYPTIILLIDNKNIIAPIPGFQTVETIQPYLFYFGEQVYTISNLWEAFLKGYSAPKFSK